MLWPIYVELRSVEIELQQVLSVFFKNFAANENLKSLVQGHLSLKSQRGLGAYLIANQFPRILSKYDKKKLS